MTANHAVDRFDEAHFIRLRWIIYSILAAAYILVFFHRIAPAVVSADLMQAFGASGAALGSLAAMYYYIYTVMQIPAGVLADTLGARVSVTIGNLVSGLGSIIFGMADSLAMASVGRALVGLGVSVVFVGLMKSNTQWFRDRDYGFISGLTLLLGNVGAILAAGPLATILTLLSWRTVFIALGIIALGLAALSWFKVRNTPQEAGFPSIREMEGHANHQARQQHWLYDLWSVVWTVKTWPGFWVNLGMPGTMFTFISLWAVPFLRDVHGLERASASLYTSLTLAGFAMGAVFNGWFSDRLGRRKPLIILGTVTYAALWLYMTYGHWTPGALGMAWFVLMGFSCGTFVLTYALAKEVMAPALSGMSIALVNTGMFLGAAIMQPLFGWIMDQRWDGKLVEGVRIYSSANYQSGFFMLLAAISLAVVAALLFYETRCRNITLGD